MDLGLGGKVVLVTGGAQGIGAAAVRRAAAEGGRPVIIDQAGEAARHLRDALRADGHDAYAIEVELGPSAAARQAVEGTLEACGRLDVLVNNAGANDRVGLEGGSPEAFRASLERNLYHAYDLAHYALAPLRTSAGAIVNVASKTALTGQGQTSGYAAAKGGLLALTREWAVELSPYNIRVNAVVPAEVWTPMYERWLSGFEAPDEKRAAIERRIPLGQRMTTPDEVASMIVYLASAQASHITGQLIHVDGGYVHLDRALAGVERET